MSGTKDKFIVRFLETVRDMIVEFGTAWAQVPYKGFRYSDFDRYGYNIKGQRTGLNNLKLRGYIKNLGHDQFVFTSAGNKWLLNAMVRYFRDKNQGKWDKKWRVIIFDIPQEMHKQRIRFRRRLESMGFIMLQKSVFVFPYSCHEEVGDVVKDLRVSDFIDIIVAESIGFREEELQRIFGL